MSSSRRWMLSGWELISVDFAGPRNPGHWVSLCLPATLLGLLPASSPGWELFSLIHSAASFIRLLKPLWNVRDRFFADLWVASNPYRFRPHMECLYILCDELATIRSEVSFLCKGGGWLLLHLRLVLHEIGTARFMCARWVWAAISSQVGTPYSSDFNILARITPRFIINFQVVEFFRTALGGWKRRFANQAAAVYADDYHYDDGDHAESKRTD